MADHTFSQQLESWLKDPKQPKTIGNLVDVFCEKSFAMVFLLLMITPALPIPTGGVTHVFEVIVMLVAIQLVAGRHQIWLPKKWQRRKLGALTQAKTLPFIMKKIRQLERLSRPRLLSLTRSRHFLRYAGGLVFFFSLTAFLAPPFSGLDTLPALGVVFISLALILGDMAIFVFGVLVGLAGLTLDIWLGDVIYRKLFNWLG